MGWFSKKPKPKVEEPVQLVFKSDDEESDDDADEHQLVDENDEDEANTIQSKNAIKPAKPDSKQPSKKPESKPVAPLKKESSKRSEQEVHKFKDQIIKSLKPVEELTGVDVVEMLTIFDNLYKTNKSNSITGLFFDQQRFEMVMQLRKERLVKQRKENQEILKQNELKMQQKETEIKQTIKLSMDEEKKRQDIIKKEEEEYEKAIIESKKHYEEYLRQLEEEERQLKMAILLSLNQMKMQGLVEPESDRLARLAQQTAFEEEKERTKKEIHRLELEKQRLDQEKERKLRLLQIQQEQSALEESQILKQNELKLQMVQREKQRQRELEEEERRLKEINDKKQQKLIDQRMRLEQVKTQKQQSFMELLAEERSAEEEAQRKLNEINEKKRQVTKALSQAEEEIQRAMLEKAAQEQATLEMRAAAEREAAVTESVLRTQKEEVQKQRDQLMLEQQRIMKERELLEAQRMESQLRMAQILKQGEEEEEEQRRKNQEGKMLAEREAYILQSVLKMQKDEMSKQRELLLQEQERIRKQKEQIEMEKQESNLRLQELLKLQEEEKNQQAVLRQKLIEEKRRRDLLEAMMANDSTAAREGGVVPLNNDQTNSKQESNTGQYQYSFSAKNRVGRDAASNNRSNGSDDFGLGGVNSEQESQKKTLKVFRDDDIDDLLMINDDDEDEDDEEAEDNEQMKKQESNNRNKFGGIDYAAGMLNADVDDMPSQTSLQTRGSLVSINRNNKVYSKQDIPDAYFGGLIGQGSAIRPEEGFVGGKKIGKANSSTNNTVSSIRQEPNASGSLNNFDEIFNEIKQMDVHSVGSLPSMSKGQQSQIRRGQSGPQFLADQTNNYSTSSAANQGAPVSRNGAGKQHQLTAYVNPTSSVNGNIPINSKPVNTTAVMIKSQSIEVSQPNIATNREQRVPIKFSVNKKDKGEIDVE